MYGRIRGAPIRRANRASSTTGARHCVVLRTSEDRRGAGASPNATSRTHANDRMSTIHIGSLTGNDEALCGLPLILGEWQFYVNTKRLMAKHLVVEKALDI